MNRNDYLEKVSEYSEKAKMAQADFNDFLESNKSISAEEYTDDMWKEHDRLVDQMNTIALEWCGFCTTYRNDFR